MGTKRQQQDHLRYAVLKTAWGYFGLLGTEREVYRTYLPVARPEVAAARLLAGIEKGANGPVRRDDGLHRPLQEAVASYFEGERVDFRGSADLALALPEFTESVLRACRDIQVGRTLSYGALAARVGKPKAARAVGSALARNPVPLIVPCHRVLCNDGRTGGFSAPGGTDMKKRLLRHEQRLNS